MRELRQKSQDEIKQKAIQQQKLQHNHYNNVLNGQMKEKNNKASSVTDIFFKKPPSSSENSSHSNISVQKKKNVYSMMSFQPNNSLAENSSPNEKSQDKQIANVEQVEIQQAEKLNGNQTKINCKNKEVELKRSDINKQDLVPKSKSPVNVKRTNERSSLIINQKSNIDELQKENTNTLNLTNSTNNKSSTSATITVDKLQQKRSTRSTTRNSSEPLNDKFYNNKDNKDWNDVKEVSEKNKKHKKTIIIDDENTDEEYEEKKKNSNNKNNGKGQKQQEEKRVTRISRNIKEVKKVESSEEFEDIYYEDNDNEDNNKGQQRDKGNKQKNKDDLMIDEDQADQGQKKQKKQKVGGQKEPYQFKPTKEGNYVPLDMKRKYRDRFQGGVNNLKKTYTKNGRIRQKFKNKVNSMDVDGEKPTALDNIKIGQESLNTNVKSEQYQRANKQNMYINCLSEGLLMTLDDGEEEEQDKQFKEINFSDHSEENLQHTLQIVYGFENFRAGQLDSIKSIIKKESTLIVQSTGHGKSLIYQLPTLFMKGMAIVICPLISLMMDQVQKLPKYITGVAYNSSLNQEQKQKVVSLIKEGQVKILYISPEVLQSDFSYFFKSLPEISYVCIDEAHCISEWSHNFRTSYLIINDLIQQKLKCNQIIALTATATLQTQQQMMEKLKISNVVRSTSFKRDNLKISISHDRDKNNMLLELIKSLPIDEKDSIIIYCKYKYQCEMTAQFLTYNGIASAAYHSGCEDKRKAQIQEDFMKGDTRIVVATIAFGMGIDKADIRAVVHMNMPKTVENYVQEAGRAGRDGNISYCHMFLDDEDFYRNCGYIYSDAIDYPMMKLFYEKIKKAICDIEDKNRTVRKKKNRAGEEEIIFDEELMQSAQKKFCYIELKQTMLDLDNKKESLQTLFMKIGQFQDQQNPIFKVFPIGSKNCSVWFYKDVPSEFAKTNDLVKKILEMSMVTNGCYTFNVCDMCNLLSIDPIELSKKLRELFPRVRNEFKEESLIFQILRPFEEKEMTSLLDKVYEEMLRYQEVQLNKIQFIYCISKMSSYPSIKYMLQNKLFGDESKLVSMSKYFDEYFNNDNTDYTSILKDANIKKDQVLPYKDIETHSKNEIIADVQRFLKSEVSDKEEDKQEILMKGFKNPKVITRLMQGISSYSYDYKEWKNNSIVWDKYYQHRYEELYEVVQEGISEFLFEFDPAPKRKVKNIQ